MSEPAAGAGPSSASDDSTASEVCERCGHHESCVGDVLVYCDHEGCSTTLHEACFAHSTGVKLPDKQHLAERRAFLNYCSEHALEGEQDDKQAMAHNLPPLKTCVQEEALGGARVKEYYLPQPLWQKSLEHNCKQHSLEVKKSSIAGAGKGLFATNNIKQGEVIGYFYGMYRSHSWVTKSKIQVTQHPCVWPASQMSEEDFSDSAFTGQFRFLTCKGMPTLEELKITAAGRSDITVLVVSMQCPLGWANSPSESTGKPAGNAGLVVNPKAKADWCRYCATAKTAIKQGEEIIFDYGWTKTDWRDMQRQRKIHFQAQELEQEWRNSSFTAHQMWAWAYDYEDWTDMPVHWNDRDGLAVFLGVQHAEVPTADDMKERCDKVFGSNKRQTHILCHGSA